MPQYPPCTLERVWEAHGLPVLRAAIDLPAPAESSRIRKFYALQSRAYLRYCESFLLPRATAEAERCLEGSRPFHPHQAELTGRVTFQEGPLLSLRVQSREEGEGIFLQHRGDTWDLAAGTPVSLGQFLQKPGGGRGSFMKQPRQTWTGASAAVPCPAGRTGGALCAAASTPGTFISQRKGWPFLCLCMPSVTHLWAFLPFFCPGARKTASK